MPTVRDRYIHLSDLERRERVADLLARGVVRHLRERRPDPSIKEVAHKAKIGLEVSAKTRLHVSRG
jgi:hypothetical protein